MTLTPVLIHVMALLGRHRNRFIGGAQPRWLFPSGTTLDDKRYT